MLDCSGEFAYRQERASEERINCGWPPIANDDMRVPRLPCSLLQEAGRIKQKRDVHARIGARQHGELWRLGSCVMANGGMGGARWLRWQHGCVGGHMRRRLRRRLPYGQCGRRSCGNQCQRSGGVRTWTARTNPSLSLLRSVRQCGQCGGGPGGRTLSARSSF